jgi:hypothetical protein
MESNSGYPEKYSHNGALVGKTKALSTNMLHYAGYKLGAKMAEQLNTTESEIREHESYETQSDLVYGPKIKGITLTLKTKTMSLCHKWKDLANHWCSWIPSLSRNESTVSLHLSFGQREVFPLYNHVSTRQLVTLPITITMEGSGPLYKDIGVWQQHVTLELTSFARS